MTYKQKHDKLMLSISEFMNDFEITDKEKKESAISISQFVIQKSAYNPNEGRDMFNTAANNYLDDLEEREAPGLN